jgi:choline kinase
MKAVILAAGRGSRMKTLTARQPKCLVRLAGKPLLFWQLSALAAAGVDNIAVVAGYCGEMIREYREKSAVPYDILENARWAGTNMLSTLLCAADWAQGQECVISYSDIVYPARHVNALMKNELPLALTYDIAWEELWRLRNDGNPLNDAETFLEQDGVLQEIGGRPESLEQVQGQYMGLLKFSRRGWQICQEQCLALGSKVDALDMTDFLRFLLAKGVSIGAVQVSGAWCEVDNAHDLQLYETALAVGTFSHDWRN